MIRKTIAVLAFTVFIGLAFGVVSHSAKNEANKRGCGLESATVHFEYEWPLWICATNGNVEAQTMLGFLFWSDSTSEDRLLPKYVNFYSKAGMQAQGAELIKSAAIAGNAKAANELGLAYFEGTYGQPKDYEAALQWLSFADEKGDLFAPPKPCDHVFKWTWS